MYSKYLILSLISFSGVNAFISSPVKPITSFKYAGDTKPVDYFDPLQLTSNSPETLIKYVREAELQHGRISMMAFVTMLFSEILDDSKLGINQLSSQSWEIQFPFWFTLAIFEIARMKAGWQNPFTKEGKEFKLTDEYQPGNILNTENYTDKQLDQELNNGRLAMLGTLGMISQELVTHQQIF